MATRNEVLDEVIEKLQAHKRVAEQVAAGWPEGSQAHGSANAMRLAYLKAITTVEGMKDASSSESKST